MKIACSPLFLFSIRQLATRHTKSQHGNSRGPSALYASDYHNIDDLLRDSIIFLDSGRPLPTGAVWTRIFRLMSERQPSQVSNNLQLEQNLVAIFRYTMDSLDKIKPKDLATITLSMAKIVKNIREASQMKRMNYCHRALGSLLQKSNPFGHFAMAADRKLISFEERELSNIAYAYALVGHNPKFDDGSHLFQKIGDRSITCIKQFSPQGLANLVWAYATLNTTHPALFQVLGDHIARSYDLAAFDPQILGNILWAYAKLNLQHAALFEAVGARIVQSDSLASFKPQNLANFVWAYGTLNSQHPQLFKRVGDHVVQSDDLATYKPQDFANILWAFAKAGIQHPALFETVDNHVVQTDDLAAFTPQALSNILWAHATLNRSHPALFKQIGDSIVSFGSSKPFIPQNLANIVWAYAKVGMHHPDLFKVIGHSIAAVNDLAMFKTQHLSNIAWAYAMAEIDAPFLFNERFAKELLERQHQFNVADLTQLYQWHVWQVVNSNDGLPSPLKEKCIDAHSSVKS
jgi:hypothetical protein